MQPDAAAAAPLALVPFIRVIDRIGAATVEVGQFLLGQVSGDVIDADGGFLVAFGLLLGAQLALCDVIVGDQARTTAVLAVVFVEVEARAFGVHDDRVALALLHLQQVARYEVGRRLFAVGLEADQCLGAQVGDLVGRRIAERAEGLDRLRLGQQQVALDQVGEAVVRMLAQQRFGELQGIAEAIGFDFGKDAGQRFLGAGIGNDRGERRGGVQYIGRIARQRICGSWRVAGQPGVSRLVGQLGHGSRSDGCCQGQQDIAKLDSHRAISSLISHLLPERTNTRVLVVELDRPVAL